MNRLKLRVLQGMVFVPAGVFVNDILIGFNQVSGDIQLHNPEAKVVGIDEKSWVLVNRMSDKLHGGTLQSGDLVVLTDPHDPKRNLVRRIVRCGKDWIRVKDGDHEYHVYLKGGYCWVEGREVDNLIQKTEDDKVYDSRSFGPIPQGLILGLPIMVSWPLSRLGSIYRSS
jgi:hypothetical protein